MIGWPRHMFEAYVEQTFKYTLNMPKGWRGSTTHLTHDRKPDIILIWSNQDKDLRTIVHECVHAAGMALESSGWKYEAANDEPLAYLTDKLFSIATRGKYDG